MNISIESSIKKIGNFFIGGFWGLFGVVVFLFSQIFAILFCRILGFDSDIYEGVNGFVAAITGIVMILLLCVLRGGLSIRNNTLVYKDKIDYNVILPVLVLGFGLMGVVILYFFAADIISQFFPKVSEEVDNYNQAVDRYAVVNAEDIPVYDSWLNFIAVTILVPIVEELTFRGVLLGELLRKMHPALAIILSALIFGLMHGISVQIGYALISGILIGFVYYITHSIYATILLHAWFNLWGSGLITFLESGIFGNQDSLIEGINLYITNLDLFMIIPAIMAIFFLIKLNKARKESILNIQENNEAIEDCE